VKKAFCREVELRSEKAFVKENLRGHELEVGREFHQTRPKISKRSGHK